MKRIAVLLLIFTLRTSARADGYVADCPGPDCPSERAPSTGDREDTRSSPGADRQERERQRDRERDDLYRSQLRQEEREKEERHQHWWEDER